MKYSFVKIIYDIMILIYRTRLNINNAYAAFHSLIHISVGYNASKCYTIVLLRINIKV